MQGEGTLLLEASTEVSDSMQVIDSARPSHEQCTAVVEEGKERWLHDGYHYRCDKINRDGSMSVRCIHYGCVGRIKILVDGTTVCVTSHNHKLCTDVSDQQDTVDSDISAAVQAFDVNTCSFAPSTVDSQEEEKARLHEVKPEVSDLLQAVDSTRYSDAPYTAGLLEGNARWLHEGYRYRRDRINCDGSVSLRCVHYRCVGRIKLFVDGTVECVTSHTCSHEPCSDVLQEEETLFQKISQQASYWLKATNSTRHSNIACTDVLQDGKQRWLHDGYLYLRDDCSGSVTLTSFRCVHSSCVGRINILVDGRIENVAAHNHEPYIDFSQQDQHTIECNSSEPLEIVDDIKFKHEPRSGTSRGGNDNWVDEGSSDDSDSLQTINGIRISDALCTAVLQERKGKWLHEGYCYRRDRENRDGSVSLRCVRENCAGRVKKLVDGTAVIITVHSHRCIAVKNKTRYSHEPCIDISQGGKERWLHKGYRYRRDRINQDGSMSLRCVHQKCGGRIRTHEDGTSVITTPHSHSCDVIKNRAKRMELDTYDLESLPCKHSGSVRRIPEHITQNLTRHDDELQEDEEMLLLEVSSEVSDSCTNVSHEVAETLLHNNSHEVSDLLQADDGSRNSRALCAADIEERKERWLHEEYCYRRDKINRDGSTSLRCVHFGCVGRIKKLSDGTVVIITPHSERCNVRKNGAKRQRTSGRKRKRNFVQTNGTLLQFHTPANLNIIVIFVFALILL